MQKKLHKIYTDIEGYYKSIIVEDFNDENVFLCVLKASFSKSYEFNILCNNLPNAHDVFFLMPTLRGICEDLIALKYLKDRITVDRNELLSLMTQKRTLEGTVVQKSFFEENKPDQIILELNDAENQIQEFTEKIKAILVKNGLKGDKEFPSVAQMATDSKLIKLYDYLYYATSKMVHFDPGLLLRLGWSDTIGSKRFTFSTKNFNKYYADFCSYYSSYLFLQFYKAFKKDLKLDELFRNEIKQIQAVLDDELRMPEIVTFEECNIKPPSFLAQMLYRSQHKLKNDNQ